MRCQKPREFYFGFLVWAFSFSTHSSEFAPEVREFWLYAVEQMNR